MQVSSFIPAAPAPSASGRLPDRGPREQGFDSVYEAGERRPPTPDTARERGSADDSAIRRKQKAGDADAPRRAEERQRGERPAKETGGGDDASTDEAAAGAAAEPPDVEAAADGAIVEGVADGAIVEDVPDEAVVESAGTVNAGVPDEAAIAVAEVPARRTVTRTQDAAEEQRPVRATVAAETARAKAGEAETPAAATKDEAPAPSPADPGRTATATAETVQARAARPLEAEEVVVRRVRADETDATADGAEPRIDTRHREAEVKAPKPATVAVMADALVRPTVDPAAQIAADPALAEIGATEVRTTAEHVARAEATVRHDTPRPVMQQVAEAARALRDGPVELTLQPEELGKVRMTMTAGADGSMTMSLQAERSETLDLLRRHIGDLARDLQDLGFSNLNFSFGQDRAPSGQNQRAGAFDGEGGEHPVAAIPLADRGVGARPIMASASGGLDLRL